jgi:rhomboid protease GluP
MMEERLSTSLVNSGFKRIDSNVGGIYLFYRADENDIKIVSIIHLMSGTEISAVQYEHILNQVKSNFAAQPKPLQLLNIFFTREPGRVKQLCAGAKEDSHWIIDCSMNRLMIYETQTSDFYGLKEIIEQLLAEEQNRSETDGGEAAPNYENTLQQRGNRQTGLEKASESLQLTPANIIIILFNVLAFILTNYTHIFGGSDLVIEKGALSWYQVKESGEYYRIITSMFMHSDLSHLFNNMLVLMFIGGILERTAGRFKYLIIYFSSGIIAGICSISYNMWREYGSAPYEKTTISIGASGAIFGIVGAILCIVIFKRGKLEQINFRQIILFVILSLYSGFANSQIDQAAHIGGFLAGLLLTAIIYRRRNMDKIT